MSFQGIFHNTRLYQYKKMKILIHLLNMKNKNGKSEILSGLKIEAN